MPDYRSLPPTHALLDDPELARLVPRHGRPAVLAAIRDQLDELRGRLAAGDPVDSDRTRIVRQVLARLDADRAQLRTVINATGVLLHTGLGRAPLANEAAVAVTEVALGYSNLEFDLITGERGRRTTAVAGLLKHLTRAEAAAVVNNNAAATLIALKALAAGRDVVVSRGQLVEIGGSYRLPEVFEASGARLREVGTTNRTRLADYERAIGPDTAALLRVHTSNYRIEGFTESVAITDLARLARSRGIPCIDDLGSGALAPGSPPGLDGEPTVRESIAAGADLVLFSGDKLLGGPQCGILLGRSEGIARIEADPLMRALRVDKMTLAALEATLRLARDPERAVGSIPLWTFLAMSIEEIEARATSIARRLAAIGFHATIEPSQSYVGGGSAPHQALPTRAVRVAPPYPGPFATVEALSAALRLGDPPLVARSHKNAIWLDPRTIFYHLDTAIIDAFRKVTSSSTDE